VLWSTQVPGSGYYLSAAPDGSTALALNGAGAVVINLAHTWRRLAAGTRFHDGKLGNHGMAVVRLADIHVAKLNISSGAVTDFGPYPAIPTRGRYCCWNLCG